MNKVLVVGGLGMVGRAAMERFSGRPDLQAVGLARRAADFAPDATWVRADLRDADAARVGDRRRVQLLHPLSERPPRNPHQTSCELRCIDPGLEPHVQPRRRARFDGRARTKRPQPARDNRAHLIRVGGGVPHAAVER